MTYISKLPNVGTTIFTTMSQMAIDHNAINLGQGFPDFHPDEKLINAVTLAMQEGHNQYPPMAGIPSLRLAITKKIENLYGHRYDPDTEVTVTAGASEALMAAILAFVHTGDEVIVIEPFYDLYIPAITLAGGVPVIVPMIAPDSEPESRYTVDWERVRASITSKTRLLILNFPHNPTGITLLESDMDALESIISDTGVIALSDEVYEHIIFDGGKHRSLSSRPALAANSVVVSSFGKTYHMTGWKVGYCSAPSALMKEIRKVHQFNVFTVTSPMQVALAQYMTDPEPYLSLSAFYQDKHDHVYAALQQTRLQPVRSEGTFFLLANYADISDMPEIEFSEWLTKEKGVTVIPVSAFYENPTSSDANHSLVRLCFAKQDHTLDSAIEKLKML